MCNMLLCFFLLILNVITFKANDGSDIPMINSLHLETNLATVSCQEYYHLSQAHYDFRKFTGSTVSHLVLSDWLSSRVRQ